MKKAHRAASCAALFVGVGGSLLAACGNSDGGNGSGQGGTAGASGVTGAAGTTAGTGTMGVGGTAGAAGTTGVGGNAGAAGTTGGAGAAGAAGASGSAGTGGMTGSGGAAGVGDGAAGAGRGGSTGDAGVDGGGASGSAPSAGCGKAAGLMSGRASIDVAGKTREYILALPSNYDQNQPYRLIFAWHPWGGSAQQVTNGRYFGLSSVINGQAILVAPEGQPFQSGGLGWGNANGEDIAFLHAMLDRFGSQLCIDQNRIFSTGFSFGAMFSFTLACTEMSMMRAIAPMAGNATTSGRCESSTRSVATLAFIGVDDTLLSGHRQAVQIFVQRNGCSAQTMTIQPSWCDGLSSNNQPCTCVEYQGCKAGYPVVSCEFKGGHTPAPNAGATLWNFFSQF
jgi:polyhydroxybutyrate depolymerase